jgi:hypothetical protein
MGASRAKQLLAVVEDPLSPDPLQGVENLVTR